jgi:hypothetical protein
MNWLKGIDLPKDINHLVLAFTGPSLVVFNKVDSIYNLGFGDMKSVNFLTIQPFSEGEEKFECNDDWLMRHAPFIFSTIELDLPHSCPTDEVISKFLSFAPALQKLNLTSCSRAGKLSLQSIAKNCIYLRKLILYGHYWGSETMDEFIKCTSNLLWLESAQIHREMTPKQHCLFIAGAKRLNSIKLNGSLKETTDILAYCILSTHCNRGAQMLKISGIYLTCQTLGWITTTCPNLEELSGRGVCENYLLEDLTSALVPVLAQCRALRTLIFTDFGLIGTSDLQLLYDTARSHPCISKWECHKIYFEKRKDARLLRTLPFFQCCSAAFQKIGDVEYSVEYTAFTPRKLKLLQYEMYYEIADTINFLDDP